MVEPKLISKSGVPAALEKATRYRLLNEPLQAESICRDILAVEPSHQDALIVLLLSITDQFDSELAGSFDEAKSLVDRIDGDYEKSYYEGIIHERWGNVRLTKGEATSIGWYRAALRCYSRAEELSDDGNDDAILRWNTCIRIMNKYQFAPESTTHDVAGEYGDDVPLR